MSAIAVLATLFGCGAASRELLASEEGAAFRALLGSDHKYKVHEQVPLYANKVGPFHNPVYAPSPAHAPLDRGGTGSRAGGSGIAPGGPASGSCV